jgi:hypothetical protein
VLALAAQETRRLLLHPVTLLGWAIFAANAGTNLVTGGNGPRDAYETVETLLPFFPGILLILSANLVATRDHRAGSTELLAGVPVPTSRRTAAQLLAGVPVALLGLVVVLGVHLALLGQGRYVVAPGPGQILQGPLCLAGAVCLGTLVARWSTARVAILLVVVTMVMVNVLLNSTTTGAYFGPMFNWAAYGLTDGAWAGLYAGSPLWRTGYLTGLVGLAAAGAMLPVSPRPRRVVGVGLAVLAFTAVSGVAMLP